MGFLKKAQALQNEEEKEKTVITGNEGQKER